MKILMLLTIMSLVLIHDQIHMNSVFDDNDDFLSAEIEAIIDHRY